MLTNDKVCVPGHEQKKNGVVKEFMVDDSGREFALVQYDQVVGSSSSHWEAVEDLKAKKTAKKPAKKAKKAVKKTVKKAAKKAKSR